MNVNFVFDLRSGQSQFDSFICNHFSCQQWIDGWNQRKFIFWELRCRYFVYFTTELNMVFTNMYILINYTLQNKYYAIMNFLHWISICCRKNYSVYFNSVMVKNSYQFIWCYYSAIISPNFSCHRWHLLSHSEPWFTTKPHYQH